MKIELDLTSAELDLVIKALRSGAKQWATIARRPDNPALRALQALKAGLLTSIAEKLEALLRTDPM